VKLSPDQENLKSRPKNAKSRCLPLSHHDSSPFSQNLGAPVLLKHKNVRNTYYLRHFNFVFFSTPLPVPNGGSSLLDGMDRPQTHFNRFRCKFSSNFDFKVTRFKFLNDRCVPAEGAVVRGLKQQRNMYFRQITKNR
jgi:hypothetical protein